jgi:predicted ATP-binding protein involved in virulence
MKRIKQISVKNLFGMFDHTIPLNMDERITIMHGPNGFGKTAILRLLNALFSQDDSVFHDIPFEEFRVQFDDNTDFLVNKTVVILDEYKNGSSNLTFRFFDLAQGELSITLSIPLVKRRPERPHLVQIIDFDKWTLLASVDEEAEDTEKKLGIFDELANKIDLLKRIINKRFLYKEMTISKGRGFIFTNSKGVVLSPDDLSSGEQHELILFYELLFKVAPGSLILIDEPEISLHVVWQEQFLEDVLAVTRLSDIDVLLATHSPDIIAGRRDLMVELKGPE